MGDTKLNERTLATEIQWSNARIYKNLVVLSFATLLLFTGYNGIATLQSTINKGKGIGVASQAVIYAAFCVSALLLPKLVIRKWGLKTTLLLSFFSYCPYIAANFYASWYTMLPTGLLLGTGASTLWASSGTYLNRLSRLFHSNNKNKPLDNIVALFFGISGLIYLSTYIWGDLISYLVLRTDIEVTNASNTSSYVFAHALCGLDFPLDDNEQNEQRSNIKPPIPRLLYILTTIYVICGLSSLLLMALVLDNLPDLTENSLTAKSQSVYSYLTATLRHLKNANQIKIIPLSFYIGLFQGFYIAEYTQAYVACAWGIYHVGFVSMAYGVGSALSSGLSGKMVKFAKRPTVFAGVTVVNIVIFSELLMWDVTSTSQTWFLLMGAAFGIVIGIVWSQIRAFYGVLFPNQEEAAFANYSLWSSLGYCLSFSYSPYVSTGAKVYAMIGVLSVGMIGYAWTEVNVIRSNRTDGNKKDCIDKTNT